MKEITDRIIYQNLKTKEVQNQEYLHLDNKIKGYKKIIKNKKFNLNIY